MTDDVPLPTRNRTQGGQATDRTDLVAVPDDPEDTTAVTLYPEDVAAEELATAWLSADAETVLDLAAMR